MTPEIYGYDVENHLLCMEDLGTAGDFTDGYQLTQLSSAVVNTVPGESLIDWLRILHALPVAAADAGRFENCGMRELNHQHIFKIPLDANNGLDLDPAIAELVAQFTEDSVLKSRADDLGEIYLGRTSTGSSPCLLHGDYYPGAWLRDEHTQVKIIDPEFAFIGAPEFDVGVFFAHMTMIGYPQANLMTLLQRYAAPSGFDFQLALGFAGMEFIRRIMGVAQLPLNPGPTTIRLWLESAHTMVTA